MALHTLIVLIRGINVGGHKKLKMADLKSVCESVGLTNVATYLQSGNVVCESKERPATVAARVAAALRETLALDVGVIVRTTADLARVVEANPFADAARTEPNRVMVMFLDKAPASDAAAALLAKHAGPELLDLQGAELHIHYVAGAGSSMLTNVVIERALGVTGTARNWNTVTALLEMAKTR